MHEVRRRASRGFCLAAVLMGVGVALVIAASGRDPEVVEWLQVVGAVVALAGVAIFERVDRVLTASRHRRAKRAAEPLVVWGVEV